MRNSTSGVRSLRPSLGEMKQGFVMRIALKLLAQWDIYPSMDYTLLMCLKSSSSPFSSAL